ncbi:MAG: hypothetical protein WC683_06925 [bacterium]
MSKKVKWMHKRRCQLTPEQSDVLFKYPLTCGACGRKHIEGIGPWYMAGEFVDSCFEDSARSNTVLGIPLCETCGDKVSAALQSIRQSGMKARKP